MFMTPNKFGTYGTLAACMSACSNNDNDVVCFETKLSAVACRTEPIDDRANARTRKPATASAHFGKTLATCLYPSRLPNVWNVTLRHHVMHRITAIHHCLLLAPAAPSARDSSTHIRWRN